MATRFATFGLQSCLFDSNIVHTDALGTDEYNNVLSGRRAGAVESYLLEVGVSSEQIVALAEGEAKPRRPNSTEEGEDNPTGRRANRRTEIYLDF